MVTELKEIEDRNDHFMQDLLKRAEVVENQKVEKEAFRVERDEVWAKFKDFDNYNKENHVHYI